MTAELMYDVAFVLTDGDRPEGDEWEDFMQRQRDKLNAYAEKGWMLATAVPVIHPKGQGSTFRGVLFYFAPQEAGTRTRERTDA